MQHASAIYEMEAWHDQNMYNTIRNHCESYSAKQLHITISDMDAPLGTIRTQLIQGYGTLRHTIAPLIGSHKIICTRSKYFQKDIPQTLACRSWFTKWNNEQSKLLAKKNFGKLLLIRQSFLPPKFSSIWYYIGCCVNYMSCTTPACFSAFFSIYYGPYSSWKFLIFLCACL